MVRPDFEHGRLMRLVQLQQRHRHADVVVEARFAPERLEPLPQDCRQQLFGRRLAIGAAHRDHGRMEIAPITGRQFAQRLPGVFDRNDRASQRAIPNFFPLSDHRCRFLSRHVDQKIVAVELVSGQGDE